MFRMLVIEGAFFYPLTHSLHLSRRNALWEFANRMAKLAFENLDHCAFLRTSGDNEIRSV